MILIIWDLEDDPRGNIQHIAEHDVTPEEVEEVLMPAKRIHRKIERTPEQQRQLEEIQERFQRDRPGLEDLLAAGDATEAVPQGEYLELRTMLGTLKKHRERQGLSLTDVAARSGMDRAAISRLENGVYLNPTVDTLYRYAQAVGADIGFSVRVS
jgi:DNA-binding XRE family transcriptional regulator